MSTATAIIPHWNHRELLQPLFASLRAQTRQFDEIIVVDNGSTDGSPELAEELGARVLHLEKNLGFAAAVNRGIEATQSDWIAILNNDVVLDSAWLAALIESAERERADFATGKILRADQRISQPATIDGTFDEISRGACAYRCGAAKPDSTIWNQPRKIRMAPMTAAIFRAGLFREIGPLDEAFVSYLEDVDFGLRCAIACRAGIYVPKAVAKHRGSATLGSWSFDTVRWISRNQFLLRAKYFQGQPHWPILVGQLLWGLLAFRHGQGVAWINGKFSGWKAVRKLSGSKTGGMVHWPITANRERVADRVRAIVQSSEGEIFGLERESGFSPYWRMYFWLVRRSSLREIRRK
jgi:GT2 family glycosyltransferase